MLLTGSGARRGTSRGGWGGGGLRLELGHEHWDLEFGDSLELEDEDLHHPHQEVSAVAVLLLASEPDALDEVEEELAGHGLDARGEGLVVDVARKQLDGAREVRVGQMLANVVDLRKKENK